MNSEMMEAAARRLGWALAPERGAFTPMVITGNDGEVPVRIERTVSDYHLATTAFLDPPLPLELAITHEGIGGALASLLGFKDVTVGDPDLDKSFRIVAPDAAKAQRLFTPEVKAALHALSKQANARSRSTASRAS